MQNQESSIVPQASLRVPPVEREIKLSKKQKVALGIIVKRPQSEAQQARNAKAVENLRLYHQNKKATLEAAQEAAVEDFSSATGVAVQKPKKWVRNTTIIPGRPPGGREFIKTASVLTGPSGTAPRPMQPSAVMANAEHAEQSLRQVNHTDEMSFSTFMQARAEWETWKASKPEYKPSPMFIGDHVLSSYKKDMPMEKEQAIRKKRTCGAKPAAYKAAATGLAERGPSGLGKPVARSARPSAEEDEEIDEDKIQRRVKKASAAVEAIQKLDSRINSLSHKPAVNPFLALLMQRG